MNLKLEAETKTETKANARRWFVRVSAGLLVAGLTAAALPARAQEPQNDFGGGGEGESKGRPLDGYFGTGILAFGALFLIGKSARR